MTPLLVRDGGTLRLRSQRPGASGLADTRGPRPAKLIVIGGHAVAPGALAVFASTGIRNVAAFAVLVAVWSVFAWALKAPLQASMLAAAPDRRPRYRACTEYHQALPRHRCRRRLPLRSTCPTSRARSQREATRRSCSTT